MRIPDVPSLNRLLFTAILAGFSVCTPAMAQQTLGAITGTVKDVSGAVVP
jgi:hypothetical protein